jgi:hypothetical protein
MANRKPSLPIDGGRMRILQDILLALLVHFDDIPERLTTRPRARVPVTSTRRFPRLLGLANPGEPPRQANPDKPLRRISLAPWLELHKNGSFSITAGGSQGTYSWKAFFQQKAKLYITPRVEERLRYLALVLKRSRAREILAIKDEDVRTQMLARYGYQNIIDEAVGQTIHEDGDAKLIGLFAQGLEPVKILKVAGRKSGRTYAIRVPSDIASCNQAIVWALGMHEDGRSRFELDEYVVNMLWRYRPEFADSFSPPEMNAREELLFEMIDMKKLRATHLTDIPDAVFQDRLLRAFGLRRFVEEGHGFVHDRNGGSELIEFHATPEIIFILKVIDSTSGQPHFLRVPSNMWTCKRAVAWTFGMSEQDYFVNAES